MELEHPVVRRMDPNDTRPINESPFLAEGVTDSDGATVVVIRLSAGEHMTPQVFGGSVSHEVLEGAYENQGRMFPAGILRCIPHDADVGSISTSNGVTIRMVYDSPLPHVC